MITDLKSFIASVPVCTQPLPMLSCKGSEIVDDAGRVVRLRGANIGAWMNMEYYLHGIFGTERVLRGMAREVLGEDKGRFLFDSMLEHFFTEKDVAYLKGIGTTVLRITLNARHFEAEDRPFEYLEEGFARVDEALRWCEKYGMYAILDLHAVYGFQNGAWICDNSTGEAAFWNNEFYLKRFLGLWQEFARRYQGRSVVAGYDLLNEPDTFDRYGRVPLPLARDSAALNRVYREAVTAIRRIDREHIIFLEGDHYAEDFDGLDAPFAENLAYSSHNYSFRAISAPFYPGVGTDGAYWDKDALRREFLEKQGTQFCRKHQVPLWVGEFGSRSYTELMDDQIAVFEEFGAHWTVWQHKDVGYSSLLRYRHDCAYLTRFNDLLDRFGTVYGGIDGRPETPERKAMREECGRFEDALLAAAHSPYTHKGDSYHMPRWIDDCFYAKIIAYEFLKRFEAMSLSEIDDMFASSFAIENCVEHPLAQAVKNHCLA